MKKQRPETDRQVRRVLIVTLGLNLAVVAGKAIVGLLANSLSILSDAGHSLTDSLNNVLGLLIARVAWAEADEGHPYGHRKIESLAAFGLGGLLLFTCFEIGRSAILRIVHHGTIEVEITAYTIGVMVATILINIFVYLYERRAGERLGSQYLVADSLHTRSDILITGSLLLGLFFISRGLSWLDPIIALAITTVIAYTSWQIFRRATPILVDATPIEKRRIEEIVMGVPGVESVHDIRSRSDGDRLFVEFHLLVIPNDVDGAHRVTEEVEARLAEELGNCHATIHVEPT